MRALFRRLRGTIRALIVPAALSASLPACASAQQPGAIPGFSREGSYEQREFEAALMENIWADTAARYAIGLSSRPHVAGTAGQVATRDSVITWLTDAGLDASYDSLILYLPQPLHVSVSIVSPDPLELDLSEPPIPGNGPTEFEVPVFNAYSGNGTGIGEVVYVNYGLPADYEVLDSLGVSVEGRVVVARYGRSFRGIKAREAAKRGAAALLMYSDPSADGFEAGEVYPDGPFRPELGVQRGSILNSNGDPSTPEGPSLPGSPRVLEDQMEGLGRIPVVPIGYGPAGALLGALGGHTAPEDWQGGLPFTYRVGPGATRARVEVRTERGDDAYHPAFNTIGIVRGSEWPDEWIVVGGHRDAWGAGAIDDVSGTTSVVAAARAFGELARAGQRPRRSILFATWDAEEWGILGSIEWVEARADSLRASAVAYLNQDVGVSGSRFGAAASPEMKALIRDAAAAVAEPDGERSVYDGWLERARSRAGDESPGPESPPVGDMGGGSDHKAFYQHLGIPVAGFGFGGSGGVYHSMYDTPDWMQRFGDPGYRYHATVARIVAVAAARLANADVLPFEYREMARIVSNQVDILEREVEALVGSATGSQHEAERVAEIERRLEETGLAAALEALHSAIAGFETAAGALDAAVTSGLEAGPVPAEVAERINQRLRQVGPALTSDKGLPGDSWSRQLLFASDPDNGYATLPLPGIRLALRTGSLRAVASRIHELAAALKTAAAELEAASQLTEW